MICSWRAIATDWNTHTHYHLYWFQPARDGLLKDCFDISKTVFQKTVFQKTVPCSQFGPIIELLDAIPDSTLSAKQVVPQPSEHNSHKCHDVDPESTVWTEILYKSIRISLNKPKKAFPRSGDRPRGRKIKFAGPGPGKSENSLSKDSPAQIGLVSVYCDFFDSLILHSFGSLDAQVLKHCICANSFAIPLAGGSYSGKYSGKCIPA